MKHGYFKVAILFSCLYFPACLFGQSNTDPNYGVTKMYDGNKEIGLSEEGRSDNLPYSESIGQDEFMQHFDCPLFDKRTVSVRHGKLYAGGARISKEDYMLMCYHVDKSIWEQYRKGIKQRRAGAWLTTMGSLSMATWLIISSVVYCRGYEKAFFDDEVTTPLFCISVGFMVSGIPVYCVGNKKLNKSVQEYNSRLQEHSGPQATLNIGFNSDGIGLSMTF